jgi:hypothetical protein
MTHAGIGRIRTQRVVIECHGDEWWLMLNDGTVQVLSSPEAAHKAVRQAAARGNKTATITTVEWRNAPDGFKPPKE